MTFVKVGGGDRPSLTSALKGAVGFPTLGFGWAASDLVFMALDSGWTTLGLLGRLVFDSGDTTALCGLPLLEATPTDNVVGSKAAGLALSAVTVSNSLLRDLVALSKLTYRTRIRGLFSLEKPLVKDSAVGCKAGNAVVSSLLIWPLKLFDVSSVLHIFTSELSSTSLPMDMQAAACSGDALCVSASLVALPSAKMSLISDLPCWLDLLPLAGVMGEWVTARGIGFTG
mmetsp:Transcript_59143/g.105550  ORF Transcript_59143/g.105550 Transcript_59143/m.105550 type:complete len:228 (-) Transcript_59143:788-1471(-)